MPHCCRPQTCVFVPGATLASLASHEKTASFIMDAPGDSVAKAMLALLEVEDEPGLSNAGPLLTMAAETSNSRSLISMHLHLHHQAGVQDILKCC